MLSSFRTRVKNIQLSRVEILFILFALLVGIPMIVLIPPGAGYDEEDHLVRVWELSSLSLIPGQMSPQELQYPTVFRDFAYRQQGSSGLIQADFWKKYTRLPLSEYEVIRREIATKSVYSPPLLLPQAIAMRVFGRSLDLPALPAFYLCRFASLLSYLFLVWLAIRLIPYGKWILLVLALVPMALFQATTVSPDAISNGIGFLFIAGSIRTAQSKEIGWRETGSLVILIFLLFLAKLNLVPLVLLPFLLIGPFQFTEKRIYLFWVAATIALFFVEVVGWNMIAAARSNPLLANEANPTAQLLYVLGHPLRAMITVIKDLITSGWSYFVGWINGYGYYYWTPPAIVSLFFVFGLSAALLIDSAPEPFTRRSRAALLLVFVASYLATVLSLYLTFTPVGRDQILGVQGRYFIPLALLLFLAVMRSADKAVMVSRQWITSFLAAALFLNVVGIFLSFHVPCGTTFYQTSLCYRPLSRDFTETRVSPEISKEVSLIQEFRVACDGLAEVRVLVNPAAPGANGSTRFIVQDPLNDQTLFDGSLENNQISTQDWYPLRFDPDWNSAGKEYVLNVRGESTPPGQGIQFLYTTQSEFNLGDFHENKQSLEEDLVLQYGCITGLRKLWLTGKP